MENYRYYNGEKKSPYIKQGEFGKDFWWRIELYAVEYGDHKEKDVLSPTMVHYIKERMWEGGHNTNWETAVERATELYIKGVWSRAYISNIEYTFEEAERMNNAP